MEISEKSNNPALEANSVNNLLPALDIYIMKDRKSKTEWGLVSIAHYMKKLAAKTAANFFALQIYVTFLHLTGCLEFLSNQLLFNSLPPHFIFFSVNFFLRMSSSVGWPISCNS
jgi:hypothetical protein